MYASEAKKSEFLVHLDHFSNISNVLKNGLNEPKTQISLLPRHTQLSPIILSQVRLFSDWNYLKKYFLKRQWRKVHIIRYIFIFSVELLSAVMSGRILDKFWKSWTCKKVANNSYIPWILRAKDRVGLGVSFCPIWWQE